MTFDFDLDPTTFELDLDLDLDDLLGPDAAGGIETGIMVRRYPRISPRLVAYERAEDFAAQLPDLDPDVRVHALVSGNFIFGDFLEALMVRTNYYAEKMLVATLSLGRENADSLHNLQRGGYVGSLALIVSDYWFAHERRREGGVPYILDTLGEAGNFRMAAAGLHTKITLIRTSCGRHLVIHGSANLRSSRNLEQFTIENDPELFAFHREWMEAILDRFAATRKSPRGDNLWQTLTEPTRKAASQAGEKAQPQPRNETPSVSRP